MSKNGDFLSGFSGGNTQKPLTEQHTTPAKETTPPNKETPSQVNVTENKKLADKMVAEAEKKDTAAKPSSRPRTSGTATRPAQSASAIIKAPEHVVTKDSTFHKRQMTKYGIFGGVAIVVAMIGFFVFRMLNTVEIPNWVGEPIEGNNSLNGWLINNNISVTREEAYSLEFDEGIIMLQNREPESTIQAGATITFTVSLGPNMNEIVELPDFEAMTRAQITAWMNDMRIRGITFREQSHAEIENNHVIRVDFPSTVDPENFRRSDSMSVYVSTGPETVTIGNMVGNTPEQFEQFIEAHPALDIVLEYEPHRTIERGTVLAQSHSPGTRLPVGETLTLTLSAGIPIPVPNFANIRMSEAEAMSLDFEDGLAVDFVQRYHDTVIFGRFISQSVAYGEELYGENPTVQVVYSLGRPWIDMWGTEQGIERELFEMNDRGASLSVEFRRVNSWEPRGTVVSQSHYGQRVPLNTNIIVEVSLGNLQPPVDAPPPIEMPPGDDD
ncbi:MAG: PASTA domain-containing protein [Defluviitaleaceae bacterium]|nr:PASTA domain-containing protein [Defluviitaleaceae bacterium]